MPRGSSGRGRPHGPPTGPTRPDHPHARLPTAGHRTSTRRTPRPTRRRENVRPRQPRLHPPRHERHPPRAPPEHAPPRSARPSICTGLTRPRRPAMCRRAGPLISAGRPPRAPRRHAPSRRTRTPGPAMLRRAGPHVSVPARPARPMHCRATSHASPIFTRATPATETAQPCPSRYGPESISGRLPGDPPCRRPTSAPSGE